MPYKLRKAPGQPLYWVVSEDGKHHSKEPMPKENAKAQLRALYANTKEGGGAHREAYNGGSGLASVTGLTGGDRFGRPIVTAPELARMSGEAYSLAKGTGPPREVGEWKPVVYNPTVVLYGNGTRDYILAVRGTKEARDKAAWIPVTTGAVDGTERFLDDLATCREWKERFPGTWYGTGHSLGGAIIDNLIALGLVGKSMTFNPAVEAKLVTTTNQRIYFQGDPLLALFGSLDPNKVVVSDPTPSWFTQLFGFDVDLGKHGMSNFDGQLDDVKLGGGKAEEALDVEALFAALEGLFGDELTGGAYAPLDKYKTAENIRSDGTTRPQHEKRDLRDMERGLRALAHKNETVNPLASFGARVMADDLFEHRTGQALDWGHNNAETIAFKEGYRASRADQADAQREVTQMMAQLGDTDPKRAYRILYQGEAPPVRGVPAARVKTPAEVRAEEEREEREAEAVRVAGVEAERKRREEEAERQEAAARQARRRAAEEVAMAKLRAEQEAARVAEEMREATAKAEREAADAAQAAEDAARDRVRAEEDAKLNAARLAAADQVRKAAAAELAALEETDEDEIAFKENDALLELDKVVEGRRKQAQMLKSAIAFRKNETDRMEMYLRETVKDPLERVASTLLATGYYKGGDGTIVTVEGVGEFKHKDLKKFIKQVREEGVERGQERYDKDRFGILVKHPATKGQVIELVIPWDYLEALLDQAQQMMAMLERAAQNAVAKAESKLTTEVAAERQREKDAERELAQVNASVEAAQNDVALLRAKFAAAEKKRAELKKKAAPAGKKKGKGILFSRLRRNQVAPAPAPALLRPLEVIDRESDRLERELNTIRRNRATARAATIARLEAERRRREQARPGTADTDPRPGTAVTEDPREGMGRQHKAFVYSRPGMTTAEKAAERAQHYRSVKQVKEGRSVAVKGAPMALQYYDEAGKEVEYRARAAPKGVTKLVVLTEAQKTAEAARGKKEVTAKKTVPKKESARKPYVGKKMKEVFMEAVKGKAEKEQRNLFNKAKREYKEGGVAWEDLVSRVSSTSAG